MLVKDRFSLAGFVVLLFAALMTTVLVLTRVTAEPAAAEQDPLQATSELPSTAAMVLPSGNTIPDTDVTIAIHLDGVAGASSFARPGDRVDLVAFLPSELAGQAEARVLLRGVLVADSSPASAAGDSVLTISTSPDQAVLIVSAASLGIRPFTVLRPSVDSAAVHGPEQVSDVEVGTRVAHSFAPATGE